MIDQRWRVGVWAVMAGSVMLLTGCQTEQLMLERDRLWQQNQELQEELSRTRTALESSEADRDALSAQVHDLRSAAVQPPIAPVTPPPPIDDRFAANTAFSAIEGIESFASAGRVTVRIPGDVLFSPGRVDLKKSAVSTLGQIAKVIQNEYPSDTIRVEGYTDTDPIRKSKWTDNLELSLQRAASVHRQLQKQGVDPHQLEAVGLGQWFPRETKAKSRRVDIVVVQGG